jgi:hypothetical protein
MKTNRIWKPVTLALMLIAGLFFGAYSALAASSQFTIGLSVISDSIPPSTPIGLTANAVSSAQIDLSWTASTDNVAVDVLESAE